jgi:hypothetical protein
MSSRLQAPAVLPPGKEILQSLWDEAGWGQDLPVWEPWCTANPPREECWCKVAGIARGWKHIARRTMMIRPRSKQLSEIVPKSRRSVMCLSLVSRCSCLSSGRWVGMFAWYVKGWDYGSSPLQDLLALSCSYQFLSLFWSAFVSLNDVLAIGVNVKHVTLQHNTIHSFCIWRLLSLGMWCRVDC